MKLITLRLKNFQGAKDVALDAQGGNLNIFGANGTGKTTLFTAFNFLLFGKDSHNKTDFSIKGVDTTGEAKHNLEHEVEGTFDIGGREITFRKVYLEKWTKKRGSTSESFTGHETKHYIDGVPATKREYDDTVSGICDESTFRLLTSPAYFNEILHWEERRKVLLAVCGDVSDPDVIASDKKLKALPDILGDRALDDHKKVVAERRRRINTDIKEIGPRIDEVEQGLPDVSELDHDKLTGTIQVLNAKHKGKLEEKTRIEAGGEVAAKTKELNEVEADILVAENAVKVAENEGADKQRRLILMAKELVRNLTSDINGIDRQCTANDQERDRLEERAKTLRTAWHTENDKQFTDTTDDTCAACGQSLPKDKVEAAREKALAAFNVTQSTKLEENNAAGVVIKTAIETLNEETTDKKEELMRLEQQRDEALAKVEDLESAPVAEAKTDETEPPQMVALRKKGHDLETAIVGLRQDSNSAIAVVEHEIASIDLTIETAKTDLGKFDQRKTGEARIEELSDQEKKLAKEYEELEGELHLCEEFIRAKVAMLTDKINSKFKLARFRLFEEQINEGVRECCDTLVNGVPYGSGLNNAMEIAVGIDIIDTLAEHYGFRAPVFIDNAEAITDIPKIDSQLIALYVSKPDKALRIEAALDKVKEAV